MSLERQVLSNEQVLNKVFKPLLGNGPLSDHVLRLLKLEEDASFSEKMFVPNQQIAMTRYEQSFQPAPRQRAPERPRPPAPEAGGRRIVLGKDVRAESADSNDQV